MSKKLKSSHPLWKQVENLTGSFFSTMAGTDCINRSAWVARGLRQLYPDNDVKLIAGRRSLRYGSHELAVIGNEPEAVMGLGGAWPWHCWIEFKNVWIDPQTGRSVEQMARAMDAQEGVSTVPRKWPFRECLIVQAAQSSLSERNLLIDSRQVGWCYMPNASATEDAHRLLAA